MKVWMLQWNFHVPATGAVNVAVFPASIVTSNPPVLSDVTVCWELLVFFTVTVPPAFTGVVVNLKLESIVICPVSEAAVDAPGVVLPDATGVAVLLLLPHAARPAASAVMAMRVRSRRCMLRYTERRAGAVQFFSRGSPRVRSPITLRWISFVPAQIELAW